jgi:hypothetical protein
VAFRRGLAVALLGRGVGRFLSRPSYLLWKWTLANIRACRLSQRIFDDPMDVAIDLVKFVGNVSFLIEKRLIRSFYFFSLLVR